MSDTITNLGIVIPGFAGVYDPGKSYQFYEFVRDGNDTYISKKPCTGIPTSNSEYWFRVTDIGPAPTVQVGEVITLAPGSSASVTNVGDEQHAVLRFELPGGTYGPAGEAATFSVVQTLTGEPGTQASATEAADSTPQQRKYILTVPTGAKGTGGEAATIAIGQVSTGMPNSEAIVENVGTPTHAIFNITIPAGMPGHDGDGSGDMVRATYDIDENGIVDDSERLGGRLPEEYAQAGHQHMEYLQTNGDGSSVTVAFSEAAELEALTSGGTLSVLFGRVAKWISALKNGVFAKQADLDAHISNQPPHVSAEDRQRWDDAADGGGIVAETDPTVPGWAKQPKKPPYIVEEIDGAVPSTRTINGKALSADLTITAQDVGAAAENHSHAEYLLSETDPTVPQWAKQPLKPSYAYDEIVNKPALALVATTGSYGDLSGKPDLSGFVPSTRAINGKALSADITLSASDVAALPLAGGTMTGTLTTANTAVGTFAARNIQITTTDLTPGVSPLTTGAIVMVYE